MRTKPVAFYAVNVVVSTRGNDAFKKVAITKYPIIVTGSTNSTSELLNNPDIQRYIQTLRTRDVVQRVYDLYVRVVYSDGDVTDVILPTNPQGTSRG